MQTEDIVQILNLKIDKRKEVIRAAISSIMQDLVEIGSSLDFISYASYLKDDLISKDIKSGDSN